MRVARSKLLRPTTPSPQTPRKLRKQILERNGNVCQVCGRKKNLKVSYLVPLSRGGKTVRWSLVTLCEKCRPAKSSMLPFEFCSSPYFHLEILRPHDSLTKKITKVKVVLDQGEVIRGKRNEDPRDMSRALCLTMGEKRCGKVFIPMRNIRYVEEGVPDSDLNSGSQSKMRLWDAFTDW